MQDPRRENQDPKENF